MALYSYCPWQLMLARQCHTSAHATRAHVSHARIATQSTAATHVNAAIQIWHPRLGRFGPANHTCARTPMPRNRSGCSPAALSPSRAASSMHVAGGKVDEIGLTMSCIMFMPVGGVGCGRLWGVGFFIL